jgi:hypothetical protein
MDACLILAAQVTAVGGVIRNVRAVFHLGIRLHVTVDAPAIHIKEIRGLVLNVNHPGFHDVALVLEALIVPAIP